MSSMSGRSCKMLNWLVGAWILVVRMEECNFADATKSEFQMGYRMLDQSIDYGGLIRFSDKGLGYETIHSTVKTLFNELLEEQLPEVKNIYLEKRDEYLKRAISEAEDVPKFHVLLYEWEGVGFLKNWVFVVCLEGKRSEWQEVVGGMQGYERLGKQVFVRGGKRKPAEPGEEPRVRYSIAFATIPRRKAIEALVKLRGIQAEELRGVFWEPLFVSRELFEYVN